MAAIELYTPQAQGAEMVSGMIDVWALWAGVIMRLEHHLVGGYVRYVSPYIIIIIRLESQWWLDLSHCQKMTQHKALPQQHDWKRILSLESSKNAMKQTC